MDVSDVLRDRMAGPSGLERMVVVSAIVHGVFVALLILGAPKWAINTPPPKTVMTISLAGGNGGPENGGMTSIGGRAVQAETPPLPTKKLEPITEPAPVTPEMTIPTPKKAPPPPPTPVKKAPEQVRGKVPTRGPEARDGSAIAETGARGQGFGLATSGGVGTGARLDVANFCCPEYVEQMVQRIRSTWNEGAEVGGIVIVKFTIQRNGSLVASEVERSSGYTQLDLNALRAVLAVRQLPPLPAAYPNATLPVHLTFEYRKQ